MSSFNRRSFILLAAAPAVLAGCGFEPAFGPDGQATNLRGRILVDDADTRDEFTISKALERKLGQANRPDFGLSVALRLRQTGLAITPDQETTRFNVLGQATYALRDLSTGEVYTSGKVDSFTGYSATGTTVATLAAERDAKERLTIILADKIIARLIAASASLP